MKKRRRFYNERVGSKLRVMRAAFVVIVIYMFATALYDSFVHDLPFYYIFYALGGPVVGRVFQMIDEIAFRVLGGEGSNEH